MFLDENIAYGNKRIKSKIGKIIIQHNYTNSDTEPPEEKPLEQVEV